MRPGRRRLVVEAQQTPRRGGAVVGGSEHRLVAGVAVPRRLAPPSPPPGPAAPPERAGSAVSDAGEVGDVAEHLVVAGAELVGARQGGGRRRGSLLALGPHSRRLALLRLRELRCDHDQAQVDHEERPDLRQTPALARGRTDHYANICAL